MKIGEVVIRSYAWPDLVPGIIVEYHETPVQIPDNRQPFIYMQTSYDILWSDGSTTNEIREELQLYYETLSFNKM